jgi:hypothetical protein
MTRVTGGTNDLGKIIKQNMVTVLEANQLTD